MHGNQCIAISVGVLATERLISDPLPSQLLCFFVFFVYVCMYSWGVESGCDYFQLSYSFFCRNSRLPLHHNLILSQPNPITFIEVISQTTYVGRYIPSCWPLCAFMCVPEAKIELHFQSLNGASRATAA